jgi:hypothetical protein
MAASQKTVQKGRSLLQTQGMVQHAPFVWERLRAALRLLHVSHPFATPNNGLPTNRTFSVPYLSKGEPKWSIIHR